MRNQPGDVGSELRRLRKAAGMRQEDVARLAGWDASTLSRLETGKAKVDESHLCAVAQALNLTPVERMRLDRLAGGAHYEPVEWWARYHEVLVPEYEQLIYLESIATTMHAASTLVPGPMQTEGYATATIMLSSFVPDPDDADALLQVRLGRRRVITDGSVQLTATLAEAVLTHAFCGPVALQEQLRYLLDLSDLENVSLKIVPSSAEAVPFLGGVTILDTPESNQVALVEYQSGTQLLKDERTVRRYRRDVDRYRAEARSEEESRRMIMERLGVL
ncbi:helix-turn-helix domain-containing protein [Embleya sp. AB8]|uniref:helix-turn-helix domain-containing protein n=1 Tax=Embleya sp. AB8 TaxID=3156304 RepID=UPI003C72341C